MEYFYAPDLHSTLTLIIAPPAWGKTYRLLELFRQRPEVLYVFVSPLRALANEFHQKICSEFQTLLIENNQSWMSFCGIEQVIIATPETLVGRLSFQENLFRPVLFILDEFHLYSYWGTTFRECMWESMIEIALTGKPMLAMTATFGEKEELFFQEQFQNQIEQIIKINYGNQTLLYPPKKKFYVFSHMKKNIRDFVLFELEKKQTGTVLFFVQYRKQVELYEKLFSDCGYQVLSCVGGEAEEFSQKLKHTSAPNLIIATTVLSHGVNLPKISCILFSYEVQNFDFWIQMVGRGGRKGESYNLYTFDPEQISRWSKLKSLVKLHWILMISHLSPWEAFANED
jgi:superfamily II DNA or RNA helicase